MNKMAIKSDCDWHSPEDKKPKNGFEVQTIEKDGSNKIRTYVSDRWYSKSNYQMPMNYSPEFWRYINEIDRES